MSEPNSGEATAPALERHYTANEIAILWNWSEAKVREVFRDEPGVLQSRLPSLLRRRRGKRQNISHRIPESVVLRVHASMSEAGTESDDDSVPVLSQR